LNQSSYNSW